MPSVPTAGDESTAPPVSNFHCSKISLGRVNVKIVNHLGELVESYHWDSTDSEFSQHIDISNLRSGLYYVEVIDKDRKMVRTLIKN